LKEIWTLPERTILLFQERTSISSIHSLIMQVVKFHRTVFEEDDSDAEKLWQLARNQGVSEYEIYLRAARVWGINESSVETAFIKFLFTEDMPWWVRNYVR
jgi:hypothetical protein